MAENQDRPAGGRETDEGRIERVGPQVLIRLAALIRTARTYDVANQAFQRQVHDSLVVLNELLEDEPEVALAAVGDYFYLNGVRIKATAGLLPIVHSLLGDFERRGLGGVRFLAGVNPAEIERFFQLFMAADNQGLGTELYEMLEAASIAHIAPVPRSEIDSDDLARKLDESRDGTERGRAQRVFWNAVLGTRRILSRAGQNGRPDLRHAKRLVQPVVDSIMNHEYSVVGLTALKDHDEYTYAHCVNVSILSVSMGNALGLDRQTLADLGVAALLHDLGKIAIPGDVLRKPAKLDPQEWQLMRRHPIEGARMLFRMPGISQVALDAMRVCLEHHMNLDRTGYPEVKGEWGQCTLSRIVALADCFDAMTAHRSYHKRPFSPFEALQYLLGPGRMPFDRAVLWALVRTVGLYPPGTALLTSSGHMVLSLTPNPNDLARPHCRVLVRPDGGVEPEEGGPTWSPMPPDEQVTRVLRPEDLQVNTAEYLAA